jgi:hypothetical protein
MINSLKRGSSNKRIWGITIGEIIIPKAQVSP